MSGRTPRRDHAGAWEHPHLPSEPLHKGTPFRSKAQHSGKNLKRVLPPTVVIYNHQRVAPMLVVHVVCSQCRQRVAALHVIVVLGHTLQLHELPPSPTGLSIHPKPNAPIFTSASAGTFL
jgi:hypothetical protein